MNFTIPNTKSLYRITVLFCFGLIVGMSLLLWKERVFFIDPAFHLFLMIKDGTFPIQVQRFGAGLTMILPLLGIKAGLSVGTLAILYSFNVALYYSVLAWINLKLNPDGKMAFALLLCYTLLMSFSFFWMQAELPMGLAMSITFMNYLDKLKMKAWTYPWIVCTLAILISCIYFHPMNTIFLIFLMVFFYLNAVEDKKLFIRGFIILLTLVIAKKLLFKVTYYDKNWIDETTANVKSLYPNYLASVSNKQFLSNLVPHYFWLIPSLVGILLYYIYHRKWSKLIWTYLCFFGFLMLVNITCNRIMPLFHIESFYLPLAGILAIPLAIDILPSINKKLLLPILLVYVIAKCFQIEKTASFVHHRYEIISNIKHKTDNLANRKILLETPQLPMDTLLMPWPIAYEVLILSMIENKEMPRNVLVAEIPKSRDTLLTKPMNDFVGSFKSISYNSFPKDYFKFRDTSRFIKWPEERFK